MKQRKKSRAGRVGLFLIALLFALIVTFFVSYFSVSKLYSEYLDKQDAEEEQAEKEAAFKEAKKNVENMGFTMVYLDDPDTEQVEYSLLRLFNEGTGEMSIFQIPTDGKVTLSDEVYEEATKHTEQTVERTLLLSDFSAYFSERETKYQMLNLVMEDLIGGVKINSYEAMDYDTFVQVIDLADPVMMPLSQIVIYTDQEGEKHRLAPNTEYEIDGSGALGILTYDDGFGSGDSGRMERTASYLEAFITSLTKNFNETQMQEFLTAYYDMTVTTGSKEDKEAYGKACLSIEEDTLSFYTLRGTQQEDCYILDGEKIAAQIKEAMGTIEYALATDDDVEAAVEEYIAGKDTSEDAEDVETTDEEESTTSSETATTEEETATATSDEEGDTTEEADSLISSMDKAIGIYNGAYINGLASRWNRRLQAAGYDVETVDNYDEVLENGKIIVKEEGWGKDLQQEYFPDATLEVGTPDDGMDIQIILGKSEDFS